MLRTARPGRQSGYTTMELMFVVVVMGILVLIAIATYMAATDRAGTAACRANRRVLGDAVVAYQVEFDGSIPTTLTAIEPWIRTPDTFFKCPSDDTTLYDYDPSTGRITCSLHP